MWIVRIDRSFVWHLRFLVVFFCCWCGLFNLSLPQRRMMNDVFNRSIKYQSSAQYICVSWSKKLTYVWVWNECHVAIYIVHSHAHAYTYSAIYCLKCRTWATYICMWYHAVNSRFVRLISSILISHFIFNFYTTFLLAYLSICYRYTVDFACTSIRD